MTGGVQKLQQPLITWSSTDCQLCKQNQTGLCTYSKKSAFHGGQLQLWMMDDNDFFHGTWELLQFYNPIWQDEHSQEVRHLKALVSHPSIHPGLKLSHPIGHLWHIFSFLWHFVFLPWITFLLKADIFSYNNRGGKHLTCAYNEYNHMQHPALRCVTLLLATG